MCKAFFCCAPLGAATFRRGQSKKTTPPRLCFLLRPRRKAGEGAPRWAPAQGQSKKENTGPTERSRRSTGRKKKTYSAHPGTTAKRFLETNDTGHERKGATTQQKKTTHSLRPWTAMLTHFFSGATFPAGPGWCFSFLLRPRADAHSLTAGLGGDASRRGGDFLFFFLRPRPDGVVFFFAVAPHGRSLTHCGLGRFRQGPGGVFCFLLRPRRTRRAKNKMSGVLHIGSKKTRRGHSKKKTSPERF